MESQKDHTPQQHVTVAGSSYCSDAPCLSEETRPWADTGWNPGGALPTRALPVHQQASHGPSSDSTLTSVQTDSKFLKYSFRNGLSCCVPGSQAYLHPGRFRPAMHKPREGGRGRASCHWRTIYRKSQVIHYKTAVTDQEGVSFVSLPY